MYNVHVLTTSLEDCCTTRTVPCILDLTESGFSSCTRTVSGLTSNSTGLLDPPVTADIRPGCCLTSCQSSNGGVVVLALSELVTVLLREREKEREKIS